MGSADYAAALEQVADASPRQISDLLRLAAATIPASDISVYLADFQGVLLQPALLGAGSSEPIRAEEDVAGSLPGRVFQTGEPAAVGHGDGDRVWVPLVERGERTGVVALTVPKADEATVAECLLLGRFAGLLVRSFARTTDLLHLRRRRRTMTLAAGMQWDLLPPLTVRCAEAIACGRLEPAYEIAGDAFDYAINDRHLHAAIFDGMGHGVPSTLMTTLAIGAYRHGRRAGASTAQLHEAIDAALAEHYGGEAFVTAALARLDLAGGRLEWTNAGHPRPLLMRAGRVVGELDCPPALPLGLGGGRATTATEPLEPGDSVLFYTDGVTEGRSHHGEEFGSDRLADTWQRQAASGRQPDEVLRRLVEVITAFNAGKLRDDASLMVLRWDGTA